MVSIYFDKQVYSYLFRAAENDKYSLLLKKILSNKCSFTFYYSIAHLLDLQKDKTPIKYEEMDFIQKVMNANLLTYQAPNIVVTMESPRSVFNRIPALDDYSWIEDLDTTQLSEEQIKTINNIVDLVDKDLSGRLDINWINTRTPVSSDKLLHDKGKISELVHFLRRYLFEDEENYKKIRDFSINNYNPGSITASEDGLFDQQLSSLPLKLPFKGIIKAICDQMGVSMSDGALVYYLAYMTLDMLGINKDPRKKVVYQNLMIDSLHSLFGIYCDCMVSDDAGVRQKSKSLYNFFGIETKVYSVDEFIEMFDEAIYYKQRS